MQTTSWAYDFSHSKIGFSVRHFGITETEGQFRKFRGVAISHKEDFSDLQIELLIDTTSIDTNDSQRDNHLKSADFFEAETFPAMRFVSKQLQKTGNGTFNLHGELTIKAITKPLVLSLEFAGLVPKDPFGNTKAGFFVSGQLNRKDWGIVWNTALDQGGVAVSDTVKIACSVELLKVG